jgi:Asp-tRNA(Asn)/Glu-tRNA(Gln) amidotransferase A subunit family amidase
MSDEIYYRSATELEAEIRAGNLSPVDLTKAVLSRIDAVNPGVNAFCTVVPEQALDDARHAERQLRRASGEAGPLLGIPISFKDLTTTAGIRTTFGSKIFEHHVPRTDAVVVERIRRAGAVVLGKTNTPEFGIKGVTDNRLFGHTRNPWNIERVAGGSSGGAAAALAAGMGPLAEGSDLAGSLRIPASCCGVVGLRPSLGRVPSYPSPCYPSSNGFTNFFISGPMARTVRDAALMLSVMAGPDERDPQSLPATGDDFTRAVEGGIRGWRVAWSPDLGYAVVDPEVRRLTERAAKGFETLGGHVEEGHPAFDDPEDVYLDVSAPLRSAPLVPYLDIWADQMDALVVERLRRAQSMTAIDYERATCRRTELWHVVRTFFERYDLLLTPTISVTAFPIGRQFPAEIAGRPVHVQATWFPFTFPFSLTGQPAISIPCGWTSEGLPVGLQIVGRRFADASVLRAAGAFEQAYSWAHRRPVL